ncbi:hypothetical protein OH146_11345 [Salinibacterium sp. SYSU T00001]|uniref:hypothetical protein n=1 Tax=Homoserinimonas sedimenticola TaxID=2986805 RepID=UPI002235CE0D|nr:hypothetical protein [Salinibacterium sedimenticola]MCW4386368.1 hypothetical protein [Salinibacterium sedimenticola]
MTHSDDDTPLDPAEMLALLERQKRQVTLSYVRPVAWLYFVWGFAWLLGFVLLWLARVVDWLPLGVAGTAFGVLLIASIVTSAIVGTRIGRGVQGASNFQGAVYGISWSLSGAAFAAVGMGLIHNGLSPELASLYFPSAYALMAGIMYLAGAALWGERSQLVLGVLLLVVGSISPFFGSPANNLVMAVGGGGGFLVGGLYFVLFMRRGQRGGA